MTDLSSINLPLIAAPLGGGLAVLGLFGHRRELAIRQSRAKALARAERIRNARLPEGAAFIATGAEAREVRAQVAGYFMFIGIGTFGLNQLHRQLSLLAQCGLERLVGSVLVIESDGQVRDSFRQRLPNCYRERVTYAYSNTYGGGKANQGLRQSLDNIDFWGGGLQEASTEAIDKHVRLNGNRPPGNIYVFISLGGQGADGLPVMSKIGQQFGESQMIGCVTLPKHRRLRKRLLWLKREYEKRGVFGWLVEDNLNPDPVSTDFAMVAAIVGLADAALWADHPTMPNNAFGLALGEEPGAILLYQVVAASVVGFPFRPDPSVAPRYFVQEQALVEAVLKALRRVEKDQGVWSVDLPVGEEGTSVFDLVLLGVGHDVVQKIEDDVRAARRLRAEFARVNGYSEAGLGNLFGHANYDTPFASLTTAIDESRPTCPVIVVRIAAARGTVNLVSQMVRVPGERSSLVESRPSKGSSRAGGDEPSAEAMNIAKEK